MRVSSLALMVAVCLASFFGPNTLAQPSDRWFGGQPLTGIEGDAYASCEWDPDGPGALPSRLIVTGYFRFAGEKSVSSIAQFDGVAWSPIGAGFQSDVVTGGTALMNSVIPFQNGLVASGWFNRSGNTPLSNIAFWNGSEWRPMGDGLDARARVLAIHNGQLYAAGGFLRSGERQTTCIARWDGTRWRDLDGGLNGLVTGITSFQGRLIACGDFTGDVRGTTLFRLAAWNGSRWSAITNDLVNDDPLGIATMSAITVFNGKMIVSGQFTRIGGVNARNVAAWDGTTWSPLGEGLAPETSASTFTQFRGELIAGGGLTNGVTGEGFQGVAAWNGIAWRDIGLPSASPITLTTFRDRLIGGTIFSIDSWLLGSWDGERWSGVGPGPSGIVYAAETFGNDLVVGGDFLQIGNLPSANGVARWNQGAWTNLGQGFNGTVIDLNASTGTLIAAGTFTRSGPTVTNGIAQWNGSAWRPIGSGLNGPVYSITFHQGSLYAAGAFTFAGRTAINGVARWDGAAWQPVGSGAGGTSRTVFTLASIGPDLFAGGPFSIMGGVGASGIAAWNGTSWRRFDNGVTGDFPFVYDIEPLDGQPVIAGTFDSASNVPETQGVAIWNGSEWSSIGGGFSGVTNGFALALHTHRGQLYAGGTFDPETIFGTLNQVARFDGTRWLPLAEGLGLGFNETPIVRDLVTYKGNLAVMGGFSDAGDMPAAHLAFWGVPCRVDTNNDGFIDFQDYAAYVECYEDGTCPGGIDPDFNADGFVDFFDYTNYVAAFEAGC